MVTFTNFSDLLPDPVNKINTAGVSDATGLAGPGFAKVKFRSNNQGVQVSRTRSGRGVIASPETHTWEFDINYNALTREEFEPVSTFLETRQGRYKPFYVILPQHKVPRNSTFATFCQTATIRNVGIHQAGSSTILIDASSAFSGTPSQGDFFNITDSSDANHKKAYKVTRVETPDYYQAGTTAPTAGQLRIHIQPPLARTTSDNSVINFIDPKFRVIMTSDVHEYDLDVDGLYQFSLSLEEIQP